MNEHTRASDQHEGFPATLQRGARQSVFLGKAETMSALDNRENRGLGCGYRAGTDLGSRVWDFVTRRKWQ